MVPGQPGDDAITVSGLHAMGVAGEIGEQGFVGDGDAVRETRAA